MRQSVSSPPAADKEQIMKMRASPGIIVAACLAVALPLLAAERLAVKTGLWENTVTMEITGFTLPKEQLEKMPPAQRAQVEQMMKQMGVGAPSTITDKSCLTEKDLDGNAFRGRLEEDGQDCEYQQVTATAKRQEWTFTCKTPGGPATGRMAIDVISDTQVRGAMQGRTPQGNIDMKFDAKWQSQACGDVKPD
jgi:hypothetical protein